MRFLALACCLLLPVALLAGEQPEDILKTLPARLLECERGEVHQYEKPGLGTSVAYKKNGFLVTVYVYDLDHKDIGQALADPVLREAFATSKTELERAVEAGYYADVEKRDDGTATFGVGHDVYRARYRLTRLKGDDAGNRFDSEIDIFGAQGKIIKLRITSTLAGETADEKTISAFIPALFDLLRRK